MDIPVFDPFMDRMDEMTKLTKFVRWIVCLNLCSFGFLLIRIFNCWKKVSRARKNLRTCNLTESRNRICGHNELLVMEFLEINIFSWLYTNSFPNFLESNASNFPNVYVNCSLDLSTNSELHLTHFWIFVYSCFESKSE